MPGRFPVNRLFRWMRDGCLTALAVWAVFSIGRAVTFNPLPPLPPRAVGQRPDGSFASPRPTVSPTLAPRLNDVVLDMPTDYVSLHAPRQVSCAREDPSLYLSALQRPTWTTMPVPLRSVTAIAFRSEMEGAVGGNARDCTAAVVVTKDRGRTWTQIPASGGRVVALAPGPVNSYWAVIAEPAAVTLLRPGRPAEPRDNPCARTAVGSPRFVSAAGGNELVVTCVGDPAPEGQLRLVLRSRDGGQSWTELSGARRVGPGGRVDGLDDAGALRDIQVRAEKGIAVVDGTGCGSGLVLHSSDGGLNWRRLPCFTGELAVDRILAARLGPGPRAYILARRDTRLVTLYRENDRSAWLLAR